MDLEFYLDAANAASRITLKIQDEWPSEKLDREIFLAPFANKLKGSRFFQQNLAELTVVGFLAGRAYLEAFRRITAAKADHVALAFTGMTHVLRLRGPRKVEVSPTPVFDRYYDFLRDLQSFDCRRIKQCGACGIIFQGRQNSEYCSNTCRQASWRQNNPGDYRTIQQKREAKRKKARKAEKVRREVADASRPVVILTPSKRSVRLPIAGRRKS